MDEMVRAGDGNVCRSSTAIVAYELVEIFKVRSIKTFLALLRKVAVKWDRIVPDTALR